MFSEKTKQFDKDIGFFSEAYYDFYFKFLKQMSLDYVVFRTSWIGVIFMKVI